MLVLCLYACCYIILMLLFHRFLVALPLVSALVRGCCVWVSPLLEMLGGIARLSSLCGLLVVAGGKSFNIDRGVGM